MRMDGPVPGRLPELDSIDLYEPSGYQKRSLHPDWAALRLSAPVWRQETPDGTPFWSLTRHADVLAALRDPVRFSSKSGTILDVIDGDPAGGHTILLTDPPEHACLKAPLAKRMSRYTAPDRVASIASHVERLVAPMRGGGEHDFARVVQILPMAAAGEMLGIPPEHWEDVALWTMTGLAPLDPAYKLGTPAQTLQAAHHQLFALLAGIVEERRRRPADDVISTLLALDFGGRALTDQEVLMNGYTLAMGTNSTTPHVAAHMMLALIESPSAWDALRRDRSLVGRAVEEVARWATPTSHLLRRTASRVEVAGVTIPVGAAVCLWLASANRDEAVFDDPYTFDPARDPNPHLAFGNGVHYCTGTRAARLVLGFLLESLLDGFEAFELNGEPVHLRSNFVNGMSSLPIIAHPKEGRTR
jgi:cytochrome P450